MVLLMYQVYLNMIIIVIQGKHVYTVRDMGKLQRECMIRVCTPTYFLIHVILSLYSILFFFRLIRDSDQSLSYILL